MPVQDRFDCISPVDYRYWDADVAVYLSEEVFTSYKLRVEFALIKALRKNGICGLDIVSEVEKVILGISTYEVYEEEKKG